MVSPEHLLAIALGVAQTGVAQTGVAQAMALLQQRSQIG